MRVAACKEATGDVPDAMLVLGRHCPAQMRADVIRHPAIAEPETSPFARPSSAIASRTCEQPCDCNLEICFACFLEGFQLDRRVCAVVVIAMIPITIITGFLGSGKTSM